MSTAAEQLAQWIQGQHPDFYNYLLQHVTQTRMRDQLRAARLRGFGDDLEFTPDIPDVSSDYAPSYSDSDVISSQYTPVTVDIPTVTSADLTAPSVSFSPASDLVSTDSSGAGFLSTVGSGITNAATSVASFLTSPQGLTDVAKLATAYFQVQNTKANAAVQTQIMQAQASRAAQGYAPSPITYGTNQYGQVVPVYAAGQLGVVNGMYVSPSNMPVSLVSAIQAGQSQYVTLPNGTTGYTVPSNLVGSLTGNVSLGEALPWILIIAGGLFALKEFTR